MNESTEYWVCFFMCVVPWSVILPGLTLTLVGLTIQVIGLSGMVYFGFFKGNE